jgi:hypothetical protein
MSDGAAASVPLTQRLRAVDPLVAGAVTIFLISVTTMTLHLWGSYVADARLEHVLAPRQFLGRHGNAWDDARGAGVPAFYFSPVVASMQSLFDLVGFPPWLIGRMTLTVYLTVAGCGAMVLASRLQPDRRWMPVASGLLFAFNPFTSQFIIPSGLFVPAAVLPWLLVLTMDGVRSDEPWRQAARFALLVFTVGLLNTASLLYSLLPVAVFAVLLVVLEREVPWRSLGRFAWCTAALTVLVSIAMAVVLVGSLPSVTRNISTTELPSTVAQTSSASESWRGLGFWLSYFNFGRTERPGAAPFFTSVPMIVISYLPVAFALVGVTSRRVRYWATWLVILATGIVVMSGAHRAGDTLLAWALDWVLEHVTAARALRSSYKAGPAVALVIALTAPAGVVAVVGATTRRWRRITARSRDITTLIAGAAVVAAGLVPFAGGWMFDQANSYRDIPDYWEEFFETMSAHPDDRVVVFPGVSRHRYDWGYVNDNLFDAKLAPSAVFVQTVSGSTPSYTSVIEELDERMSSDDLDSSAFAPMVRLLGARWVLVQRDLADVDIDLPERLRSASGLSLAATFGSLDDGTPALELYELDGDDPLAATWDEHPPVLVSGGEGTLANLVVDRGAPMVNLTALDDRTLERLLADGAEIVVSDGAQRRGVRLGLRRSTSVVLPADVEPSRPILVTDPLDTSTQTVLDTGSVVIDSGADSDGNEPWNRGGQPSLMFDGALDSGWTVPQLASSAVGREVRIRLVRPTLVESIVMSPLTDLDERILAVEIVHSADGATRSIRTFLDRDEPTRVAIQRRIDELSIRIIETTGDDGAVGLAELQLITAGGPLDTTTSLRVPTEIEQLPIGSDSPISYVFGRLAGNEEPVLRRRFTTVRTQELDVVAQLEPGSSLDLTVDECIELLSIDGVGIPVRPTDTAVPSGDAVELVSCEPVTLERGDHLLEERTDDGRSVSLIELRDVRSDVARQEAVRIPDDRRSSSRHGYEVPAGSGYLTTTVPFHEGWTLAVGGRPSAHLDTFTGTGWVIEDGGASTGEMRYQPQRWYVAALSATTASVLICLWLAFRRRPS